MKHCMLTILAALLYITTQGQSNEYYLKIKIDDRKELETLTRLVSIDNVIDHTVIAYANDNELEGLKKRGIAFELLPHPSSDPSKVINMATTVEQMANWDRYPTYSVYVQMMQNYATNYPNLCKIDTIGTSVQGRLLLSLKISDNPNISEAEPQLFYSSTIHGDETTGWILMLRLIDYLLTNYGTNPRVTNIVNNMEVFIAPDTNPDGTYYGGDNSVSGARRANYNGVDLNRDFPDPRTGANAPYAKETQLMMDYATAHHFILGANFHGGIELVNFPWDAWTTSQNPHADHNWYYTISRQYADLAQANGPSGYMTGENNGVTQGGDWYVVSGGRQDYMNYFHNCKEITIEVSNTKLLSTDLLPAHWNYNREALLTHIELALYGIRGFVTNPNGEPLDATVTVVGYDRYNSHVVTNPLHGNYYRMLLPGSYTLKFEAYGYIPQTISNVTVANNQVTELNVVLQPAAVVTVAGTVLNAGNGQPIQGVNVTVTGAPVSPTTTNSQGQFTLEGLMEGEYQFVFTKTGFISHTATVNVSQGMSPLNVLMNVFNGFSFEDGVVPQGFTFSGNLPWSIANGIAYDGNKSMKSGTITHSQNSTMEYTFTTQTAGNVTFWVKVSSEQGYDKFKFFIDGVQKNELSGEVDWTEISQPVTAGAHTIKWQYSKDGSVSNGLDAAWVDFISIPGMNTVQNPIPSVSPAQISLVTQEMQLSAQINITNIGTGTLNYSSTVEDAAAHPWLTLSNPNGSLIANQSAAITLNFNFAKEEAEYNANLLIDVTDSVITVPVTVIRQYTGLEQTLGNTVQIYPNPAGNYVTLSISEETPATLVVYSIDGTKMTEIQWNGTTQTFSLEQLGVKSKGVYLFEIISAKSRFVRKVFVQ